MTRPVPIEFTVARMVLAGMCLALLCSSGLASRGRAVARLQKMHVQSAWQDAVPVAPVPASKSQAVRAGIALPDVHPLGLSSDGQPNDPRKHLSALSIHARQ